MITVNFGMMEKITVLRDFSGNPCWGIHGSGFKVFLVEICRGSLKSVDLAHHNAHIYAGAVATSPPTG